MAKYVIYCFFSTGMFLNMAQVPPRFYNQQIQQQRDNYQQTKKNYYRAGSSGMSQEHQGSASQVSYIKYSNFYFFIFVSLACVYSVVEFQVLS
jgi:hypothetical protein